MKLAQTEAFRRERARYALRFTCEDCALYESREQSCAHGFPTAEHRRARYDAPQAGIVFCQGFVRV